MGCRLASLQVHHAVCLSVWLHASLSNFSFVVFLPFSCSASVKTAAVWIGGELNCSVWAWSRLSSPWDNEMTINGKAVASRSFVRSPVEQQHGVTGRNYCIYDILCKLPSNHFILNSCWYDVENPCKYITMKATSMVPFRVNIILVTEYSELNKYEFLPFTDTLFNWHTSLID